MSTSRLPRVLAVACVCALSVAGVTEASVLARSTATHHKAATHTKGHTLRAPSLLAPADRVRVSQVPALTWNAIRGAVGYQYEVAADPRFRSLIVVSASAGKGIPTTHNLAASLEKPVSDGTYYWRVRGVSKANQQGPWSSTRTIVKRWADAPQLEGPADGTEIQWPSTPLVLHWSKAPYAYEYLVTIARDEGLANIVVGSATSPVKTSATVFSPPTTLQTGQTYYWAITPVDADGHRGTRSRVGHFTWSWPTQTKTSITPLNSTPGETTFNWTPEFTWAPIPGAARYEVEVNSAEGFPPGSTWFKGTTIGTSVSPLLALNNNEYFWRVRAIDTAGHFGQWNGGPRFTKAFDNETPTIHDLIMTDSNEQPTPEYPTTGNPIIKWSPVAGAASYEVLVEAAKNGCSKYEVTTTATPAWTPIDGGVHIQQSNWPSPQPRTVKLEAGESYCVQVAALSDVDAFGKQIASTITPLGNNGLAFKYEPRPTRCKKALEDEAGGDQAAANVIYGTYEYLNKAECEQEVSGATPPSSYLLPEPDSTSTRTPLFTWDPVPGATSYYIAISRDPSFTNVVDVAHVYGTAYAAPANLEEPLDDETTTYYWSVFGVEGEQPHEVIFGDTSNYSSFNKHSVPPRPLSPVNGAEVSTQPTFKWAPAEGALNYTIEVSTSNSFDTLLDSQRTDSTAYTGATTYPANETLYWRVRANTTNTRHEGLTWSGTQTFRRTLPAPEPLASNPTSSEAIPVLAWQPIVGAVGYEVQEELPNGKIQHSKFDSPAETASIWDGPGIWRWQVRALFPTTGSLTVPGGYSATRSIAHTVAPPSGATGRKSGSRIVISWNPQAYAKRYEVAISTNPTFKPSIESRKVTQTNWAPNVDLTKKTNKGTLYWRVAAVDSIGNVGPYAAGKFVPPCKTKRVKRKGKTVSVCVKSKHTPAKKKHG